MKEVITKVEKVEKIIYTCDICGKKLVYSRKCDVCGKDLCHNHVHNHAGDTLPVDHAGNYTCCGDCDKKLEPWRNKLYDLESKYSSKRNEIVKEFKKEFGLNSE